jgi:phage nucleotide-binding protein
MHYLDGIETNSPIESNNALVLGTALHTGIEKSVEEAIHQYFMAYPIIDDSHINEAIKLEFLIPKAKRVLPLGEYEVEIKDDDFHGFIDLLAPAKTEQKLGGEYQIIPNVYDIYDFKYSNNINHYKDSRQLHLYKYFFEKCNPGKKIRNINFLFVPKINIKQKKTETLVQFRQRLLDELNGAEIKTLTVDFDYTKIIDFLLQIKKVNETSEFERNKGWMCTYCEYQEYCQKGWNYFMKLPSETRRNIEKVEKRVIWIYGQPFCGKTTFANAFPVPLMLNTDGNIKFVDAPYIRIKDEITVEGRMTKKTLAWQVFKDVVAELEKKENNFKTIVVDLLEDLYEYCRLYMYEQLGIKHESDDSFKAWDMVRGEFLNTLKRLMALDYENIILISHEDTSKDITKRGGDKITAIKPNMQDKVALKVAGMVDVVARIVADGNERTFNFKSNEVIFGGGRLKVDAKDIPLSVSALFEVYDEANRNAVNRSQDGQKAAENESVTNVVSNGEKSSEPQRKSRSRKTSVAAEEPVETDEMPWKHEAAPTEEEPASEEKPTRVRRSRRTENN